MPRRRRDVGLSRPMQPGRVGRSRRSAGEPGMGSLPRHAKVPNENDFYSAADIAIRRERAAEQQTEGGTMGWAMFLKPDYMQLLVAVVVPATFLASWIDYK